VNGSRVRVAAAVVLVALLVVAGWCTRTPPLAIDAAEVTVGSLRVEVATNGVVEPIDDTDVRARLDGRVLTVPDPGKRVAAGEEIARIDDGPVAAELARARSERLAAEESLRMARHQLAVARDRLATDAQLFREHALTRERHRESQAARDDAAARVAALDHEVPFRVAALDLRIVELEAQQAAAVIRAPFAGTVYQTDVEAGAMVRVGDPILRLADLQRLRVRANIDQVDLGRVRVGQHVEVAANAFPGRTWSGTMAEVVPHVVAKDTRLVSEGLAELAPPTDGLVPGMTVDVDVVVAEADDVLRVPSGAVRVRDGAPFVYRIERGRVRMTPITLGLTSIGTTQVAEGLAAGDVVALGSARSLIDGMRVDAHLGGS
jgi:HlyD family secretion protein